MSLTKLSLGPEMIFPARESLVSDFPAGDGKIAIFLQCIVPGHCVRDIITINAPLILKMREIIFFLRANYIMGHFKGLQLQLQSIDGNGSTVQNWC